MKTTRIIYLALLLAIFFSSPAFPQEQSADDLYQQAVTYYEQGLRRMAKVTFEQCLAVQPKHAEALRYLQLLDQPMLETESVRSPSEPAAVASTQKPVAVDTAALPVETSVQLQPKTTGIVNSTPLSLSESYEADEIRRLAIEDARRDYELSKKEFEKKEAEHTAVKRKQKVEQSLDDAAIRLEFEYQFVKGEQEFEIIDTDGSRLSQLSYPIEGGMGILNAEVRLLPRVFLGGTYRTSNFDEQISQDEDFYYEPGWVYQTWSQNTEEEMTYYDVNLYYRWLDLERKQIPEKIASCLLLDSFSFDVFGGWHQQDASYTMRDPVEEALKLDTAGQWWEGVDMPWYMGLNSPYEITYKGPRLGLRMQAGGDKFSTMLSFAYGWVETDAHGYWNLRDYNFWQDGDGGRSINIDLNALYHFTPHWFAGVGLHYMNFAQSDMTESGTQPGASYQNWDIVRDVESSVYGPSLMFGCKW